MERTRLFARNFNWRMLLMRVVVNMLALLVILLFVPHINLVTRSIGAWVLLALALGVLNAFVKPVIQVLTLRFIFATAGLVLILINSAVLLLLSWLFPSLIQVGGIIWALVGGAVIGIVTAFLENLLGMTQPIVSDKYPEIRQRVKDRQFYRTQAELARIEAQKQGVARQLALAKVMVAGAPVDAVESDEATPVRDDGDVSDGKSAAPVLAFEDASPPPPAPVSIVGEASSQTASVTRQEA